MAIGLPPRLRASILLGLPALVLATSCVPQSPPATVARVRHDPAPQALLRDLDLSVPVDLAGLSLHGEGSGRRLSAAPPFVANAHTPDDATRAAECLTAAVYYEARSQSADGQRAVAQVVLNRVRDRAFPHSVCGVVYQGSQRRTGCQFSFTCDGSMDHPRDPGPWARARDIAAAALSGAVYAPIGSATYYHADSIMPWWASSLARVGSVGAHIFYRWRGAMESALAFRQPYAGTEPSVGAHGTVAEATGVVVHYGRDASGEDGGAVHRGSAPAMPVVARMSVMSGVRIHVGGRPSPASGDDGGDATVSDDSRPI